MLNYLRSELYKTFRRKYTYILTGSCMFFSVLLIVLVNIIPDQYADVMFRFLIGLLPILVVMGIIVMENVFSDEYKNCTLRNSISFGISRSAVYFGKFFAAVISALVIAAIIYAFYILLSLSILGVGDETWYWLNTLGRSTLAALPLWIAGLALSTCLFFLIKNDIVVAIAWAAMLVVLPQFFKALEVTVSPIFKIIHDWQISALLDHAAAQSIPAATMLRCYIAGIIHTGLYSCVGLLIFRRREI